MPAKSVSKRSDEGFHVEGGTGTGEGEWITPEAGTVVKGKLSRAFYFTSNSGTTAAYSVTDDKGEEKLVSERASYKKMIREMRQGTTIRLTFLAKEALLDRNKKKTGKQIWRTRLESKRDGTGPSMQSLLDNLKAEQGGQEDIPF